ncbi:hypothetical protein V6N12_047257 [Hibiscus sabdariffa]|uniref:RNase H type-1 domain-containing protein n=1 Tax=Hibiscus sabdariffa TaxID=183260 RepID=A0ABR2DC20_9ROSI
MRLSATTTTSNPYSLVRAIATIRCRGWTTEAQWIPCEGNKPADMVAKFDNLSSYNVTIFSQSPESLLI